MKLPSRHAIASQRLLIVASLMVMVVLGAGVVFNANRDSQASSLDPSSGGAGGATQVAMIVTSTSSPATTMPVLPSPSGTGASAMPTTSVPTSSTAPGATPSATASSTSSATKAPTSSPSSTSSATSRPSGAGAASPTATSSSTTNSNVGSASGGQSGSTSNNIPAELTQAVAALPTQATKELSAANRQTLQTLAQSSSTGIVVYNALIYYVENGLMSPSYAASQIATANAKPHRKVVTSLILQALYNMLFFAQNVGRIR